MADDVFETAVVIVECGLDGLRWVDSQIRVTPWYISRLDDAQISSLIALQSGRVKMESHFASLDKNAAERDHIGDRVLIFHSHPGHADEGVAMFHQLVKDSPGVL
jgi:hypothetical protein